MDGCAELCRRQVLLPDHYEIAAAEAYLRHLFGSLGTCCPCVRECGEMGLVTQGFWLGSYIQGHS